MKFDYKVQVRKEYFGENTEKGGDHLCIESLENLNETIDQLFEILEKEGNPALLEELCPYFGVVWPSARALTTVLGHLGENAVRGKNILEIGCGLALPSLLAAKRGAHVVATDFHPEVPRFLERNQALNEITDLRYLRVDWRSPAAAPELAGLPRFDYIIGSDILYERQHPAIVADTVAKYLAPAGEMILADPNRPYLQSFADAMKAHGFVYETEIRTAPDTPVAKEIFILKFRRTT